ncbi:hypothetical protein HD554DRAFT_1705141 [Boletus coccyginus]|nr:hypothetical protein HD554DRAFT_1705141 [Boletus coccyginus]
MARKRARLTLKKKTDKKADKKAPDGISERKFAAFSHEYGSFTVEDPDHEQHEFRKEDVAYLVHQDSEDTGEVMKDNHWIGKIREIRGDGPDNVWIHVQWFWSPQEVAEVIKSFDPTICGKYERLLSNNCDIVSVHCVVGHVEVKHFDETSIYQGSIEDEEWFTRYHFSYDAKRVTPKVTHLACPICKVPYTPGVEKILHFCPRPRCHKFYHQSCLVKFGYVEETKKHRLLETWPDIDRTAPVRELCDSYHPRKRQKKDQSSKESGDDPLSGFPALLVAVAEQPIVRGIQGGGVVGNITSVAGARQLIYRALTQGGVIPDDWESRIDTSIAFLDADTLPNCICPDCYSPI